MIGYRVCENKYGWFKIQKWHAPKRFLFFSTRGVWKDSCYVGTDQNCKRFHSFKEAQDAMWEMVERLDNTWKTAKGEADSHG